VPSGSWYDSDDKKIDKMRFIVRKRRVPHLAALKIRRFQPPRVLIRVNVGEEGSSRNEGSFQGQRAWREGRPHSSMMVRIVAGKEMENGKWVRLLESENRRRRSKGKVARKPIFPTQTYPLAKQTWCFVMEKSKCCEVQYGGGDWGDVAALPGRDSKNGGRE